MAVLAEQIAGFIKLTDFSTVLNFFVLTRRLFSLLLLLFPTNSPCVGVV